MKEHIARSSSALYEHCEQTGHQIKPENTKVITSEDFHLKRLVKEAISIKQRRLSLNREEGLELPPVYNTLLVSRDRNKSCDTN